MEKYKKIDMIELQSENLGELEVEIQGYVEQYDNFIFTARKENLGLKFQTPIDTLKKLVNKVYEFDFVEDASLIVITEADIIKELFEEDSDVSKEVFVLMNKEGIVIELNR